MNIKPIHLVLALLLIVIGILSYIAFLRPVNHMQDSISQDIAHDTNPVPERQNTTTTGTIPIENVPSVSTVTNQATSKCIPSIKLISPNGGEVFQVGQQVTIKWNSTSCFSALYSKVYIDLVAGNTDQSVTPDQHIIANNTGSVVWTVPNTSLSAYNQNYSGGPYTLTNFINQTQFKFMIWGYPAIGRSDGPQDYSDNKFTINNQNSATSAMDLSKFSSEYLSVKNTFPPTVQSSMNQYLCNPRVVSEVETIFQRTLNSRQYCVDLDSEVTAGSHYNTYTYTTPQNGGGIKTVNFTIQYPSSCDMYDVQSQIIQCKTDQSTFFSNLDAYIMSLM